MLDTQTQKQGTRTGWAAIAVTFGAAIALGAGFVGLVMATGLAEAERAGHAAGHLALGVPAALVAVLAWRWWPRRLPSRIATVGAAILRVVLVTFCVGTVLEVIGAFTSPDPGGDNLVHGLGLALTMLSTLLVLGGTGLILLGGMVTAAAALHRSRTGRRRHTGEVPSGSMV